MSFDKNGTLQEDEYYSFGLRHGLYDNSNNNRYLYNGKEIQTDLANQYDYGARFYDPVIGRWRVVDKLAEHDDQIDKSPYAYVWDNPVAHDDPDGNCPICEMLIAGAVGAVVDYGEQVVTNYTTRAKGNPWTNVNLTEVGTSAGAAFLTGGGSILEGTGAKVAVKVAAAVVNNTVEINPSKGFKPEVNTDIKDVAIKSAIDLGVDAVAKKAGGKLEAALSKVGVTNKGALSKTAKAVVKATGNNVTRAKTATVKAGLKEATKDVAKAAESAVKVAEKKVLYNGTAN